jgi:hypothetical protein
MAAGAIVGNPMLGLSTAAAAGFAARAESKVGQVILGVGAGAVGGAISGALLGPDAILIGALAGAVAAPLGAVVATTGRQIMRNAQADVVATINKKFVNPYMEKHDLTHTQKVLVGAAAGGLGLGTTGLVAGWKGVAVMGTLGAVAGALHWNKVFKQAATYKEAASNADEHAKARPVFANVVAAQAGILAGASS